MGKEQTLEEMTREERLAYYRAWRAKNKDRVKENNRRYWERRVLARQRQQQKSEEKAHE